MKNISLILCGAVLMSAVMDAKTSYRRTAPKLPEAKPEITKDSKTGFMFGAETGFNLIQGHDSDRLVMDAGLKLGYNLFFTKTWGMRLYGSYSYNFSDFVSAYRGLSVIDDLYANSHIFLFNADALYDFYNNSDLKLSLGIIMGLGAGYEISAQTTHYNATPGGQNERFNFTRSGFRVAVNAGFSLAFASRHRIEILYRYAAFQPDLHNVVIDSATNTILREENYSIQSPFSFHIGYSFSL